MCYIMHRSTLKIRERRKLRRRTDTCKYLTLCCGCVCYCLVSQSDIYEVEQLRDDNEPSSSSLQTDSIVDRMIEELEDDRDEYSTEDNYIVSELKHC